MQLAVRLAAILLALTWIPAVAQAATAIIDQAHEHKLRAIAHIFYLGNASFTYTTLPCRHVIAYLKQQMGQ
jgi:hypothetical protein